MEAEAWTVADEDQHSLPAVSVMKQDNGKQLGQVGNCASLVWQR